MDAASLSFTVIILQHNEEFKSSLFYFKEKLNGKDTGVEFGPKEQCKLQTSPFVLPSVSKIF